VSIVTDGTQFGDSSNRSFYDTDSTSYDDQRWASRAGIFTNSSQQQILQELCATWEQSRVLEVGPGTARFSIPLLYKQNRLTLTDISSKMLSIAQKKIAAAGVSDGVEAYIEGSIYDLPFEDNSFDHAICLNVFNHLEHPEIGLKQLARVIRTGSTLLFNYANLQSYYWLAARRINKRKKSISQDVYSIWNRPARMLEIMQQAGLDLVQKLGHVHVPRAMEKYRLLPAVSVLDAVSRRGPLCRLAPYHFCLCRKRG
jgi:ubiquinone/menaquinone biosynthesis C-methylase UbiE